MAKPKCIDYPSSDERDYANCPLFVGICWGASRACAEGILVIQQGWEAGHCKSASYPLPRYPSRPRLPQSAWPYGETDHVGVLTACWHQPHRFYGHVSGSLGQRLVLWARESDVLQHGENLQGPGARLQPPQRQRGGRHGEVAGACARLRQHTVRRKENFSVSSG